MRKLRPDGEGLAQGPGPRERVMVQDLAPGPTEDRPCQGSHPVEPVPGRSGRTGRTPRGLLTGGCRRPWPSLTPDPSCKVACPALPGLGSQQSCRQVAPAPQPRPRAHGPRSTESQVSLRGASTPCHLPWHPDPRQPISPAEGPPPLSRSPPAPSRAPRASSLHRCARHSAHPGLESRVCKARLSTQ